MLRRLVIAAWLGYALAALFFYPLAAALQTDIYYLQWQRADLIEALVVLGIAGAALAGAVYAIWPRSGRGVTLALIAVAVLPLLSLLAGIARQVPFDDELRVAWETPAIRLGVPGATLVLIAAAFALRPAAFDRWLRRILIVLSPVSLVVVATLLTSFSAAAPVVAIERDTPLRPPSVCAPVVAWLFDELSFSYLYDDSGQIRPEFPAIRRFADSATQFMEVSAPARETLVAMPSLLLARHLRDTRITTRGLEELTDDGLVPLDPTGADGLFGTARRLGFRTEMAGYYLPYCELLGSLLDTCASLSFYNAGTPRPRFSLVAPIATTLILWPRQFPFGLLKNPPFAALQAAMVDRLSAFARRPLRADRPVFRFVHFSVPHMPFAFDENGYDPPLDPLRTAPDDYYVRQLRFVDRLFGELVETMGAGGTYDGTNVVLLADHGYRFEGRERNALHIPFIVKKAGQSTAAVVDAPVAGERLLKETLEQSCTL